MAFKVNAAKIFLIAMSNDSKRELNLFTKVHKTGFEYIIQIKDYINDELQPTGLCFKIGEYIWFLNKLTFKRKQHSIYKTNKSKIYFQVFPSCVCVYQETPTKSSILVFSDDQINRLVEIKPEIIEIFKNIRSHYGTRSDHTNNNSSVTPTVLPSPENACEQKQLRFNRFRNEIVDEDVMESD